MRHTSPTPRQTTGRTRGIPAHNLRFTSMPGVRRAHPAFIFVVLLSLLLTSACGGTGDTGDPVKIVTTPVPSPTVPPDALPTVPPVTYTVKPGDTLSGIADLFGVTVDDIVRANNLADPNSLQVGDVLTIPGHSPAATMTPIITPSAIVTTTLTITATATLTYTVIVPTPTLALPPVDVTPPLGPTANPNTP